MKTVLTGLLWVNLKELTLELINKIKFSYTYPHPYEDTKSFETFIEHNGRLGTPYGDIEKLNKLLPHIEVVDNRISPKYDKAIMFTGPPLRDYQTEAMIQIEKYLDSGGTTFNLAGKPGSGKSFMLSYMLSKVKVKTLIIAHLSLLTSQLYTELTENLNADIKVLDANNLELGDINIATSQFISKRPELWSKIKHNIGFIVVDESESAASETTLRILQRAHAKYRMFISATFSRSMDNRTEALTDLAGQHSIVLERKDLLKPTIIGVKCPEVFVAPASKNLFKRFQGAFYKRFRSIDEKILLIVKSSLSKNRQVLIVSDIIDMQNRYQEILKDNGITSGILNSKTKVRDRRQILVDFDEGKIDVLIGAAVLNAGLSIPKISVIIRVSFPNSHERLTQLIGRALRDYEGKSGAWLIDLNFTQGYLKREQLYKSMNCPYFKTTWERFKKSLQVTK